ncbi:hypothetical protein [Halanaerobium salsuginis]|uniref:FlgN protein n=1 Tax=Halanaerobium salsuginis TaxID=29563 RepID=A0A1I4MEG6_9FIRM|nr:hypothetical protein [Halanaerobium salsuginis]SFM01347.1 hypothetical protein SAMN02983006_02576 [Halanaerobium salsuginis]
MIELFDLYQDLKLCVEKEADLIAEDNYEDLAEIIEQKNILINKIDQIELKDFFRRLAFEVSSQTELQDKKTELQNLVSKINELQNKNMANLENKKEEQKEILIALYNREKSIKGYLNPEKYEAKFFDEKS